MAQLNDGGPAFVTPENSTYKAHDGMSLRDYFAASALTGLFSDKNVVISQQTADALYEMADFMLIARTKQQKVKPTA